ncbi:hypothetical protein MSAS_00010 [Mycobacterium saskatchewanense]|nr:hypothetical protein MSAS_00010 [Mycobacterium saskatchewanense]
MVPSFTPAGVAKAISDHRVTDTLLVPTMVQMLIDHPDAAGFDLTSLRHLIYGASPISERSSSGPKGLPHRGWLRPME